MPALTLNRCPATFRTFWPVASKVRATGEAGERKRILLCEMEVEFNLKDRNVIKAFSDVIPKLDEIASIVAGKGEEMGGMDITPRKKLPPMSAAIWVSDGDAPEVECHEVEAASKAKAKVDEDGNVVICVRFLWPITYGGPDGGEIVKVADLIDADVEISVQSQQGDLFDEGDVPGESRQVTSDDLEWDVPVIVMGLAKAAVDDHVVNVTVDAVVAESKVKAMARLAGKLKVGKKVKVVKADVQAAIRAFVNASKPIVTAGGDTATVALPGDDDAEGGAEA